MTCITSKASCYPPALPRLVPGPQELVRAQEQLSMAGGPLSVGCNRANRDPHSQSAGGQRHSCNEIMLLAFYNLQGRTQNIIIVFVPSK